MYAFVHIEKAAGTTLIHILRKNFFMRYADVRPLSKNSKSVFTAKDLKKYLKINPFIECIGGHAVVPFSDLEDVCGDIKYFTVLRDPVKRYLSHYEYWVNNMGKSVTFEQFLDLESQCDLQTKKIAGIQNAEKAIDILKDKFFVVGIVDQFDLFLATLGRSITHKPFDISYEDKNIGVKGMRGGLYEIHKERIRENNAQDILLYEYCKNTLIPEQTRRLFGDEGTVVPKPINTGVSLVSELMSRADYLLRKAYYEPITGIIRKKTGLPAKGSY